MKKKLLRLIDEEDKKNPLTDEKLARLLLINRSELTQLRSSCDIPDSRERRKPLLIQEIKKVISEEHGISERELTGRLNRLGFNISRSSIVKILKEVSKSTSEIEGIPSAPKAEYQMTIDPFSKIIGWNKSLSEKIEQAKAAVLYPPNGLHTLIVGPSGVGKSQLAEAMYNFALSVRKASTRDFPMAIFNCSDYAENPQLLLAQLFGYKKGSFTGAESDNEGLVARADKGILFLDEVHRLPPEGQEILFQLIDKGTYRKLGETGGNHIAQVMIIAATSEDLEKSLLTTFKRRIPMIIEIPPLAKRPIEEKKEIIYNFFKTEAARLQKKISVNRSTIRTLLVYECKGNIGQLKSDIQVACARGFLSFITKGNTQDSIIVDLQCLPTHVTMSLLDTRYNISELENIDIDDLIFLPDNQQVEHLKYDLFKFSSNIHANIEDNYKKLQKSGLPDKVIAEVITEDLEARVKKVICQVKECKPRLGEYDLNSTVPPKMVKLVRKMIQVAEESLGNIGDTLFYCLATHLNASIERIKGGKQIINPQLQNVKESYAKEFEVAREMASFTKSSLGVDLPEEEIGIIAMYLRTLAPNNVDCQKTIGIVVLSHGHVASGMADVANCLIGVDNVKYVEMTADDKLESIYQKTLDAVVNVDRGKGVLLLVDMGYLTEIGQMISLKTDIKIRTVVRVDTLMVIEALRKVLSPNAELNHVAASLITGKRNDKYPVEELRLSDPLEEVIICLCITGEGTARYLKNMLEPIVKTIKNDIRIITLGVLDERDILEQIEQVNSRMKVLAVVGTINPYHKSIPFIPASEVIQGNGQELFKELVLESSKSNNNGFIYTGKHPRSVYHPDLILVNPKVTDKIQAIENLCTLLEKKGFVSEHFVKGVIEREKFGSTALKPFLAIPHGNYEDILRPAVGIMKLKEPILWDEWNEVRLVFLLALNDKFKEEFQSLYQITQNEELLHKIISAYSKREIFNIITDTS
ncbi:sigma 54-interacting transcriptional regulator [Desulfitobacterium sp. AusDCA]|uniref:sigma 54-interacting transcriptional regulator n=1 Tax=Desulfitobacterium sp. AusDCA TaxID=3240383 RepID=UPI003DA767D2